MSGGRVIRVSADQSQISTDITNPPADGTTPTTVSVTVKQDRDDSEGQALPAQQYAASNVVISVTPSTGVTITQPTETADESGTVTGSFVSTNAATVSVGATAFGATITGNATVVVGGGAPPEPPSGDPFFTDDFETGARTNADGFTWNGTTSRVAVSTTQAHAGTYSLRFRYGPDAEGADSSAEQRFNTGREDTEVWVEYYLFVPTNFTLRSQVPQNNKFFTMWANSYSTTGDVQIITEYERTSATEYGIRVLSMNGGANTSGTKFTHLLSEAMAGTWIRIRVHLKCATTDTSNDGEVELWRDNTKVYEYLTHDLNFAGGNNFWKNGYFLGWSNTGYAAETDFFVDDVKFYNTDPNWTF